MAEGAPLEGAKARFDGALGAIVGLLGRGGVTQPMTGVGAQLGPIGPTQQAIDGYAEALPLDVPQGDIEGGHGGEEGGTTPPTPAMVHRLPVTPDA